MASTNYNSTIQKRQRKDFCGTYISLKKDEEEEENVMLEGVVYPCTLGTVATLGGPSFVANTASDHPTPAGIPATGMCIVCVLTHWLECNSLFLSCDR